MRSMACKMYYINMIAAAIRAKNNTRTIDIWSTRSIRLKIFNFSIMTFQKIYIYLLINIFNRENSGQKNCYLTKTRFWEMLRKIPLLLQWFCHACRVNHIGYPLNYRKTVNLKSFTIVIKNSNFDTLSLKFCLHFHS